MPSERDRGKKKGKSERFMTYIPVDLQQRNKTKKRVYSEFIML